MKNSIPLIVLFSVAFPLASAAQTLAAPPAGSTPAPAKVIPAKTQAPSPAKVIPAKSTQAVLKNVSSSPQAAAVQPKVTAAKPAPSEAPAQQKENETVPKPTVTESKIQRLISEREQLVLKYDYLKVKESSFWGNASKKDMVAVIDALKEILQKDSEIIQAVSEQTLEARRASAVRAAELQKETKRLNTQVQGDKRMVTDNIYDLKATLQNAQNLNRRRERQIKDLEEKVERVSDAKFEHDAIAAFFAMLSLVLVGYIVRLRGKAANSQTPGKKLKKA